MSTNKNDKKSSHLMIWDEIKWFPSNQQLAQFNQLQENSLRQKFSSQMFKFFLIKKLIKVFIKIQSY